MIEIMAGAIELGLFIYMFFLVCRNNTRIQALQKDCVELEKKITKLTKDTKKNHPDSHIKPLPQPDSQPDKAAHGSRYRDTQLG